MKYWNRDVYEASAKSVRKRLNQDFAKFLAFNQIRDTEVTNRFIINAYETEEDMSEEKKPTLIWENSKKNGDFPKIKSTKVIVNSVR